MTDHSLLGDSQMQKVRAAFALLEMANLLEIKGDNPFKIRAYRRAAEKLIHLDNNLNEFIESGRLQEIPGIGKAIAGKVRELVATGTCDLLERLRDEIPPSVLELLRVPGVGPKGARLLYKHLHIESVEELEQACREKRVRDVPGMGARKERNILQAIREKGDDGGALLAHARPIALDLVEYLTMLPSVEDAAATGSVRRKKAVVHDIDILVGTNDPAKVRQTILAMPFVGEILKDEADFLSFKVEYGLTADIRLVQPDFFAILLLLMTGSKEHIRQLGELAMERGFSLTETGLMSLEGEQQVIKPSSEGEIYAALGLEFIPPELREGNDELVLAEAGRLPSLVELEQIRGDLHIHTNWSDGVGDIREMVMAARRRGYEYIAITDHSQNLKIANGLDVKDLIRQAKVIREVDQEFSDITVLSGIEMDILADGEPDFADDVLKRLDIVIASIHSGFRQDEQTLTSRIIKAMQSPYVNIIAHPTGRLLGKRGPYRVDVDRIIAEAARTGTVLELNASPDRLDLGSEYLRKAQENGVMVAVNTDAHSPAGLDDMKNGVFEARRGFLEAENILNCLPKEVLFAKRKFQESM